MEDEQSLEAKCKLINEAGVQGIAGWKLGQQRPAMWDVIANCF